MNPSTTLLLRRSARLFLVVPFAALLYGPSPALATTLNSADAFAVLGATMVTNTGPTTITGDVGVSPGTAITGFPPGIVNPPGVIYSAGAVPLLAQTDATNAYNFLAGLTPFTNLTGSTLGVGSAASLSPGIYKFNSSAQLNGTLTLDFGSNPNQAFVFQIGSTLTTASASDVNVVGAGADSAVYWQVGSSATLGTTTSFEGNILALASITMNTGATIGCGRAIALTGAVTMDTNTISNDCTDTNGSNGFNGGSNGVTPLPAALPLFATGLGAMSLLGWRRKRKNAAAFAA